MSIVSDNPTHIRIEGRRAELLSGHESPAWQLRGAMSATPQGCDGHWSVASPNGERSGAQSDGDLPPGTPSRPHGPVVSATSAGLSITIVAGPFGRGLYHGWRSRDSRCPCRAPCRAFLGLGVRVANALGAPGGAMREFFRPSAVANRHLDDLDAILEFDRG
jgi:hypothetical protein